MEATDKSFGKIVGEYFWEHDKWPKSRTSIVDEWRPTVEGFVDDFAVDEIIHELMDRYLAGFVQNEIDKMNEADRTALLQFLEEGRETITGTVGCSIKCVAHDFGKSLESFVAKLEAKSSHNSSVH